MSDPANTSTDQSWPAPPDEATIERLAANHRAALASYNEHDPACAFYGQPFLAAQGRERLEQAYRDTLTTYGITPPPPETAEQRAQRVFDAQWPGLTVTPERYATIKAEQEREGALEPSMRALRIKELKAELGDRGYAQLVHEAHATLKVGEALPEAAKSNKFVLLSLAAQGRYVQAYRRAREAAGFDKPPRRF